MNELELISSMYRGITCPDYWSQGLDLIWKSHAGSGAIVFSIGPSQLTTTRNFYGTSFPMAELDFFGNAIHRRDRDLIAGVAQRGSHTPVWFSDLLPTGLATPAPAQLLSAKLWATTDILLARLSGDQNTFDVLAVHYSCSHPRDDYAELHGRLTRILPHLGRAISLTRPFQILQERYRAILDALDHIRLGVFIVDGLGRLVIKNQMGREILEAGDAFVVKPTGRLSCTNDSAACAFERDLTTLGRTASAEGEESVRVHSIDRRSWRFPYVAELSPIRTDDGVCGVLVFVVDPERADSVSAQGLKAAYKLTNSQSEICDWLLQGHTNKEIAVLRNVSPETIKSTISRLYGRLGARNRTQLIRKALSAHWPIDIPRGNS